MSERLIIEQCSPTLAGLKTGSLFSVSYTEKCDLCAEIKRINKVIVPKGLRMIPVKFAKGRALIYVYRPKKLKCDLENSEARELLTSYGYSCDSVDCCVMRLISRLESSDSFPHEIGLFLGYPPKDVKGFIENKAESKYVGYWRVYDNVEWASKKFEQYKKCTRVYCSCYDNNGIFTKLVVGS